MRKERSVLHRGNCNTARAILRPVCSSACQDRAISVSVDVQEQVTLPKHNWRLTNNFSSLETICLHSGTAAGINKLVPSIKPLSFMQLFKQKSISQL